MENRVQLLGYYGGDEAFCLSAWQSTNIELDVELSENINERIHQLYVETVKRKKKSSQDLLNMLAEHGHHCYDDQTEILTDSGWKLFEDLKQTDKVCAVDIATRKCWFEEPKQIYKSYYDEPMYYVDCQQINLAVTKGHRMVVSQKRLSNGSDYGSNWEFQKSEEVSGKSRKYLKAAQIENDSLFTESFAKLLGFFIGDGYRSSSKRIEFHLKLQRKIDFLYSLGYEVEKRACDSYVIKNLDFDFSLCYDKDKNKVLPLNILDYSKSDVENILIGLKNSDGSSRARNDKQWSYSTTSKPLKEQLITLSCIHNFVFTDIKPSNRNSDKWKTLYRLSYSERIDPEISNMDSRRVSKDYWKWYTGYVHCVTVSTGAVLVKRNSKTVVSGNTPFEKSALHFQVTADIASHIHILKHRISSANSESARYKQLTDKWYIPSDWDLEIQETKKSIYEASSLAGKFLGDYQIDNWDKALNKFNELGHELYHLACEDLTKRLGRARAKESSRFFLPYSKQLDFDVMFNFRSFAHFQNLRNSPHAQKEIREIAQQMLDLVASIPGDPFGQSLKAFKLI